MQKYAGLLILIFMVQVSLSAAGQSAAPENEVCPRYADVPDAINKAQAQQFIPACEAFAQKCHALESDLKGNCANGGRMDVLVEGFYQDAKDALTLTAGITENATNVSGFCNNAHINRENQITDCETKIKECQDTQQTFQVDRGVTRTIGCDEFSPRAKFSSNNLPTDGICTSAREALHQITDKMNAEEAQCGTIAKIGGAAGN